MTVTRHRVTRRHDDVTRALAARTQPGSFSETEAESESGSRHQRNPRGVVTCNEIVILCNIFHYNVCV